jgi:hypothetical protein
MRVLALGFIAPTCMVPLHFASTPVRLSHRQMLTVNKLEDAGTGDERAKFAVTQTRRFEEVTSSPLTGAVFPGRVGSDRFLQVLSDAAQSRRRSPHRGGA